MPCDRIKPPGGGTAIIRSRGGRYPRCKFCGSQSAMLLCDFEIGVTLGGYPITCDARICVHCAQHAGPDMDFCPKHRTSAVSGESGPEPLGRKDGS
jgi:hypothetical protein